MKAIYIFMLIVCPVSGLLSNETQESSQGIIPEQDPLPVKSNKKKIFNGSTGYGFTEVTYYDTSNSLKSYFRNTALLNVNINISREMHFRSSFIIDINKTKLSPPWLSNYYYQMGWYNWRNKTFSYGYENYYSHRWSSLTNDLATGLARGYFFISYNLIFQADTSKKQKPFFWDHTSKIQIIPVLRVHPEYTDDFNRYAGNGKPVLSTNIRYVIFRNIYVETGLHFYPVNKSKVSWDPDFTYGFGIYDWRPFTLNFSYGNWIGNRFPWNTKGLSHHGFMNGIFSLSFNWAF